MKFSIFTARSWALVSTFIFSVTCMGIVQAKECDMPDEIAAGDSAAVRAECPNQGEPEKKKKQKQRQESTMDSNGAKPDNSRSSTDGTERYDQYDNDKEYGGTGPKRGGRY